MGLAIGENNWGIPIPTGLGVGLMSPYTLAAVEKVKQKIYFHSYFQLNVHTITKHILSEYEVALFLQFFKNKEAPIPVHLCIKSLYNHH